MSIVLWGQIELLFIPSDACFIKWKKYQSIFFRSTVYDLVFFLSVWKILHSWTIYDYDHVPVCIFGWKFFLNYCTTDRFSFFRFEWAWIRLDPSLSLQVEAQQCYCQPQQQPCWSQQWSMTRLWCSSTIEMIPLIKKSYRHCWLIGDHLFKFRRRFRGS